MGKSWENIALSRVRMEEEAETRLQEDTGGLCGLRNRCSQPLLSYKVSSWAMEAQLWAGVGESARGCQAARLRLCRTEPVSGSPLPPGPSRLWPLTEHSKIDKGFQSSVFHM